LLSLRHIFGPWLQNLLPGKYGLVKILYLAIRGIELFAIPNMGGIIYKKIDFNFALVYFKINMK
tara:strand:+ start:21926 stop:22117 length:192 start_codon:yes stop_codon:yes gene_type:complete